MPFFNADLSMWQAGPGRMRGALTASVAAVFMAMTPAHAATITKVIDFSFDGSYINEGYPKITGSVQLTLQEGLHYTGAGSATANGEISVDALELYLRSSADGPGLLISDMAADVVRIQYLATDGAVRFLALSTWTTSSNVGGFQLRFRAATDIFTETILTNTFSSFQTCGSAGASYYASTNSTILACHGGSAIASDFVPTTVVPIPAALPLLASGLLGLVGIRRLKRHTAREMVLHSA